MSSGHLLPSGLHRRLRHCTGSAHTPWARGLGLLLRADLTAGRESASVRL